MSFSNITIKWFYCVDYFGIQMHRDKRDEKNVC